MVMPGVLRAFDGGEWGYWQKAEAEAEQHMFCFCFYCGV
jgi:hypothetical protein